MSGKLLSANFSTGEARRLPRDKLIDTVSAAIAASRKRAASEGQ